MESKEFQEQKSKCKNSDIAQISKTSTSGITLIALVVTIIVLLILAGISINLILGENGIITKASLAKEAQEMAELKEEAELVKATGLAENLSKVDGKFGKANLLEDLNNNFEGSILGSDRITTSDGKYDIIVDDDLNITVVKNGTVEVTEGIIIEYVVETREGIEYIDLTFGLEGKESIDNILMDNWISYIDENVYPNKEITDLENMLIDIYKEMGQTIDIEDYRKTTTEEATAAGFTYEQFLKIQVLQAQASAEGDFDTFFETYINALYKTACELLGKQVYEKEEDLEKQLLEAYEYEGTIDKWFEENKQSTEEEIKNNCDTDGTKYETYLIQEIGTVYSTQLEVTVQVSNGNSFTVQLLEDSHYSYEVTAGGEYTFKAKLPDGKKGEVTVIVESTAVRNPYGENDWEIAYTYKDSAWSTKIDKGQTAEGDIVAKFYKTGTEITPEYAGTTYPTGPEYHLIIEVAEGTEETVEMGDLFDNATYVGWQDYLNEDDVDFEKAYGLYVTKAIICDGIKSIGNFALFGFLSLEDVKISNTVTSINNFAFANCKILQNIDIPDTVTSMGMGVLSYTNISSIVIPDGITVIESSTFSNCASLKDVTIPNGVQKIYAGAFGQCTSLESIKIPDSVTIISAGAFEGCTKLTQINLSANITSINDETFMGCTSLINITIPEGVASIKASAFENCTSLKEITLPSSVTSIVSGAFLNIAEGSKIKVPTQAVKDLFIDGDNYDSTKTEIEIVQ